MKKDKQKQEETKEIKGKTLTSRIIMKSVLPFQWVLGYNYEKGVRDALFRL